MSSRLALDSAGRLVVVITASCDAGLRVGEVFVVRGNDFEVATPGIRWLGARTGRAADMLERMPVRNSGARLPDAAKRAADAGTLREQTSRIAPAQASVAEP